MIDEVPAQSIFQSHFTIKEKMGRHEEERVWRF